MGRRQILGAQQRRLVDRPDRSSSCRRGTGRPRGRCLHRQARQPAGGCRPGRRRPSAPRRHGFGFHPGTRGPSPARVGRCSPPPALGRWVAPTSRAVRSRRRDRLRPRDAPTLRYHPHQTTMRMGRRPLAQPSHLHQISGLGLDGLVNLCLIGLGQPIDLLDRPARRLRRSPNPSPRPPRLYGRRAACPAASSSHPRPSAGPAAQSLVVAPR